MEIKLRYKARSKFSNLSEEFLKIMETLTFADQLLYLYILEITRKEIGQINKYKLKDLDGVMVTR